MRNATKAGLALLIAGLVLSGAAYAASGFQFSRVASAQTYEPARYRTDADGIEALRFTLQDSGVDILPTDGDEIVFEYYQSDGERFAFSQKDGVLSVASTPKRDWARAFRLGAFSDIADVMHSRLVVRLPDGFSGDLQIDGDNGPVRISGFSALTAVEIEVDNGSLKLEEVACDRLRTKSENGSVRLQSVKAAQADLESENGSVRLFDCVFSQTLSVRSDNGPVKFERLDGPDLSFDSDNGSVKGSILGREADYQIVSDTKNGSSNLTSRLDRTLGKQLVVRTDNGSVRVGWE